MLRNSLGFLKAGEKKHMFSKGLINFGESLRCITMLRGDGFAVLAAEHPGVGCHLGVGCP